MYVLGGSYLQIDAVMVTRPWSMKLVAIYYEPRHMQPMKAVSLLALQLLIVPYLFDRHTRSNTLY